jgi:hypothetical protein
VYDIGEAEGSTCLPMEHLDGEDLSSRYRASECGRATERWKSLASYAPDWLPRTTSAWCTAI